MIANSEYLELYQMFSDLIEKHPAENEQRVVIYHPDLFVEMAQTTGTASDVISGTQDATDTADAAKEGSDSYVINGASDYTFQVRDFFPFCIPFDIYDMLTCLAADPVAPSFDWVIPVLGHKFELTIDLAEFNSVAAIVRTMETLAFAVGLAMATKKMIQGGD